MKLKKILGIFLILALILSITLTGCTKKEEEQKEEIQKTSDFELEYGEYKPKMWIVEDEETGSKIYLFGSIHMGVEDMYPLPDKILEAFNESEVLCVETDITKVENDIVLLTEMVSYLAYDDGTVLSDHISDERLQQLKEIGSKYNFPVVSTQPYKPVFYCEGIAEVCIEKSRYELTLGVDRYFIKEANKKDMPIEDIESADILYKLLGGLSDKVGEFLIADLVRACEEEDGIIKQLDGMFKAWVNGNLEEFLEEENEKTYIEEYKNEIEEYNAAVLGIRNVAMVDKIIEYLATGKTYFYVVGAAHYEGYSSGIIKLLEEKGYKVEEVAY